MKKLALPLTLLSLAAGSAMVSTTASAEVSANVAASSNYFWRGITQSGDEAAVSGGIDYSNESGFYAGTWISSLGGGASELDLYFGFSGETESFSYDVGYVFYGYPSSVESTGDADFSEIYASITFNALTLGVSVLADAEWDADFADDIYYSADYAIAAGSAEITLHAGFYDTDASFDEGNIYDGYDLGISIAKDGFTFGIVDHENTQVSAYVSYAVDFEL